MPFVFIPSGNSLAWKLEPKSAISKLETAVMANINNSDPRKPPTMVMLC